MISRLKRKVFSILPHRSVIRGYLRTHVSRFKLPPGNFEPFFERKRSDRNYLLKRTARLGRITKSSYRNRFFVSIVGLSECRRFLEDHSIKLILKTIDLRTVIPKGFLRQMEGDNHRYYRRALVRAVHPRIISDLREELEEIASNELRSIARPNMSGPLPPEDFTGTLNRIATGMLIQIFFGAKPGSEPFAALSECFHRMGPKQLVWNVGETQRSEFFSIKSILSDRIDERTKPNDDWCSDCILVRMKANHSIDETLLGNLIYMVEMGRYDMYSLFRWISKFASEQPDVFERIAQENAESGDSPGRSLAESFVFETLRMEQSERLMRTVTKDIVHDGFLIPRGSYVGLTLWESHKSEKTFSSPFEFNPERFVENTFTTDEYAPFGLGHHTCPLSDIAIKMSVIFLQVLAQNYYVEPINDGPPYRGRFHWQPAEEFTVKLTPR